MYCTRSRFQSTAKRGAVYFGTSIMPSVGVDKIIRIVLSSVGPMSPYIHEVLS